MKNKRFFLSLSLSLSLSPYQQLESGSEKTPELRSATVSASPKGSVAAFSSSSPPSSPPSSIPLEISERASFSAISLSLSTLSLPSDFLLEARSWAVSWPRERSSV